jgi:hypothetical protein
MVYGLSRWLSKGRRPDGYPKGEDKDPGEYRDSRKSGNGRIIPSVIIDESGNINVPDAIKKTKSRNLQLSVLLSMGGVETPKYEIKDGKAVSDLTGDNYEAGPNARWIISTRKASPRKFLNRFLLAFPKHEFNFDNALRVKSLRPGQRLERSPDSNLMVYTDPKSNKKYKGGSLTKNKDLSDSRGRWEYILNGVKNGGKNDIELSDEQVETLSDNKTEIFDWLKLMYVKYKVEYKL